VPLDLTEQLVGAWHDRDHVALAKKSSATNLCLTFPAFRKAEDTAGEYKGPRLTEAEVFSGKQLDLYLIPTKAGTFELLCEIEGHREAGMEGTITVTE